MQAINLLTTYKLRVRPLQVNLKPIALSLQQGRGFRFSL